MTDWRKRVRAVDAGWRCCLPWVPTWMGVTLLASFFCEEPISALEVFGVSILGVILVINCVVADSVRCRWDLRDFIVETEIRGWFDRDLGVDFDERLRCAVSAYNFQVGRLAIEIISEKRK